MRSWSGGGQWDVLWSAGLLVLGLGMFCADVGGVPLRDWDEGIVAQVAREIGRSPLESLRWLYPTLFGEPYLNKPPLMHILIALSYHLGGVSEWTTRLPGALLSAISVPLLYGVGREVFLGRTAAVLSTLVYLTSLAVVRNGRLAMLDGAVLCFSLGMLLCLLRSRRDVRWSLGIGVAFGLICLTKGILGLLLGAIALGFLAWDTPRLLSTGYFWSGWLVGSVPAIGWYLAQWLHYGALFWNNNLVDQSFSRVWSAVESNAGPPWYYLLELLKYSWPWLIFLPMGLRLAWEHRSLSWAKLAMTWGGGYLFVISAMGTKLPWYVLPVYPAIALMIGAALREVWHQGTLNPAKAHVSPYYPRGWCVSFGLLALVAWAGCLYFSFSAEADPDLQLTFGALGLTFTATSALLWHHDLQFLLVLLSGCYLSLVLLGQSDHWVWELGEDYPVKPVAAMVQQHTPTGHTVYTSHPYHRPSLNFYSDRPIRPASLEHLQQIWQQEASPYFLLSAGAATALKLKDAQTVAQTQEWQLVTRATADSLAEPPEAAFLAGGDRLN